MEAKELRINNYYLSTKFNTPVKCSIEDFYNLCVDCDGAELDSDIIGNVFKPIPLTEEWRLKAGFVNDKLKAAHNTIIWYNNHIGIKGMLGVVKPVECKYVHQLQNLFFALTGTELDL